MKNAQAATTNYMLFGLELECAYNPDAVTLKRGAYHSPTKINKFWNGETDGSLSTSKRNTNGARWSTIELTTRPFTLADLPKVLKSLRKNVFKNKEFKDVCEVNETCGNHIHFSLVQKNAQRPTEKFSVSHGRTRTEFDGFMRNIALTFRTMKRIRAEAMKIIPQEAQRRYFRSYAQKVNKGSINGGKYYEFNYINPARCEYRSFNLTGIKSWDELETAYTSMLTTLDKEINTKEWRSECTTITIKEAN